MSDAELTPAFDARRCGRCGTMLIYFHDDRRNLHLREPSGQSHSCWDQGQATTYDPEAILAEAKRRHAEAQARFDEEWKQIEALYERAKPPMVIPVVSREYWHCGIENEPLELGATTLSAAHSLQAMGDYDLGIGHGVYVGGAFIPLSELEEQYKDELRD